MLQRVGDEWISHHTQNKNTHVYYYYSCNIYDFEYIFKSCSVVVVVVVINFNELKTKSWEINQFDLNDRWMNE